MTGKVILRNIRKEDIPELIKIIIENDKNGTFYHTRKGDTKQFFSKKWYIKNSNNITVAEVDNEIKGFAVWLRENHYLYNYYTLVDPNSQGKGIGKILYQSVLSEDFNVRTEFVTNKYAWKIIKFWEKFEVRPFGFNAIPSTYNSKGEFFGDIIGGKFKPTSLFTVNLPKYGILYYYWSDKLVAPSYSKPFLDFLLKIHGISDRVKIRYIEAKPEDVFPWSKYDYETKKDFRKSSGIVGGYIPSKGLIITSLDNKILKQIEENVNRVGGIWKQAFEIWYSTL